MGNKPSASLAALATAESGAASAATPRPIPQNFHPLRGCTTVEEHEERVRSALAAARGLEGEEGLRVLGFEFRFVPCCAAHEEEHKAWVEGGAGAGNSSGDATPPQSPEEEDKSSRIKKSISAVSFFSTNSNLSEQFASHCNTCATRLFYVGHPAKAVDSDRADCLEKDDDDAPSSSTSQAVSEDEHSDSSVMITPCNRQQFIADGQMYESVANLAQEAAQSRMCTTFDLEWVTVCNDETLGKRVRALVDRDHHLLLEEGENRVVLHELLMGRAAAGNTVTDEKKLEEEASIHRPTSLNRTRSTLLIATGRGKVRAGIFSRHHLLTAGIEVGTSWHCIREARMRRWGVAIIDPNARGEGVGYESFKRSVSKIFLCAECDEEAASAAQPATKSAVQSTKEGAMSRQSSCTSISTKSSSKQPHSIYILAHSASGGQLVRHLREDPALLPSIRAVAFTDSTHNVQWAKHDPSLKEFLQTKNCVYLRSNDVRSSQSCVRVSSRGKDIWCDCRTCADSKKSAGTEAETDPFWEHRFGRIKTLWAGTADHALSNWAGHDTIWDHFDENASDNKGNASEGE